MPKLLSTNEVAELFSLSPKKTKALLVKGGLNPINVNIGKRRMDRWLESAVHVFIQNLHAQAQNNNKKLPKVQAKKLNAKILDLSLDDLYALTQSPVIQ